MIYANFRSDKTKVNTLTTQKPAQERNACALNSCVQMSLTYARTQINLEDFLITRAQFTIH